MKVSRILPNEDTHWQSELSSPYTICKQIQQDIKKKMDMSDGEDEDVIMGDKNYKEEEDAIATVTDVSGVVSLDNTAITPATVILDSTVAVDTWTTTVDRQPSPTSQVAQVGSHKKQHTTRRSTYGQICNSHDDARTTRS